MVRRGKRRSPKKPDAEGSAPASGTAPGPISAPETDGQILSPDDPRVQQWTNPEILQYLRVYSPNELIQEYELFSYAAPEDAPREQLMKVVAHLYAFDCQR